MNLFNSNRKWLLISIPVIKTITELFQPQNKFTTEFKSTWAIILKQLFVSGSANSVAFISGIIHQYPFRLWRTMNNDFPIEHGFPLKFHSQEKVTLLDRDVTKHKSSAYQYSNIAYLWAVQFWIPWASFSLHRLMKGICWDRLVCRMLTLPPNFSP